MKHVLLDFIDFRYCIGKQQIWLYAYMLTFLGYAATSAFADPLLALSILIFMISPLFPAFLMFVFYLLWEYVTTFSFGVTAVMLMQVIMLAKFIIQRNFLPTCLTYKQAKAKRLQMYLLLYICFIAFISFVFYHSTTGIGYIFKVLITFYSISFLKSEKCFFQYLKSITHILALSALVATIYGTTHETGLERWIHGMGGYVTQLYGTLGTTRMALFYLVGIIHFLYFQENKITKYGGLILFIILTLMTVSLTAVALLCFVMLIYMLSRGKIHTIVLRLSLSVILIISTFPIWSTFSFVQPVIDRIEYSSDAIEQGDTNAALTGREELKKYYLKQFEESDVPTKVLGNFRTTIETTGFNMNSHNTYIDILFYFGILGLFLLFIYQFKRYHIMKETQYFYPLISLKLLILIGASSVSIMSATYFFFLLFI